MATGIVIRHSRKCPSRTPGGKCGAPCKPRYEAWVYDRRDKVFNERTGKWEGKKIIQSFPTLSAAKGWRSDAHSGLRRGTMRAPSGQTLDEAADAWLEGAEAGAILTRGGERFKPIVLRVYRSDLKRFIRDDLGALKLSEIRRSDVQALVDRLVKAGHSASSVHRIVMPLRTICRYALERDELVVNPTANLRLPAANGRRERVATPQEAQELLDVLPEDQRAPWATAAYAGLRRGELRALRWRHVDLTANLISVECGWDEKEGQIDPKSAKGKRKVPIPTTLRRILLEHKLRTGRDGDDFVFGSKRDRPFTPTHVRKQALKAWEDWNTKEAEQAEEEERDPHVLQPIGLHELRHSYVSMMHAAGLSLETIGDFVGHSSTYMTDRYRHLLEGQETEAATRLERYLAREGTHGR